MKQERSELKTAAAGLSMAGFGAAAAMTCWDSRLLIQSAVLYLFWLYLRYHHYPDNC